MNARDSSAPLLMAAVNGARRNKKDHPALPLTIEETAQAAADCHVAGADAVHVHVRDAHGAHILDAGLYRELTAEINTRAPQLAVQITTESVGRYAPTMQRQLLYDLCPSWASVSPAEMLADSDIKSARCLYHWAAENNVRVQHILYHAPEVLQLAQMQADDIVPPGELSALFVLGSYTPPIAGTAAMLSPFLRAREQASPQMKFMACAFGKNETDCLLAAAAAGGDCRAGFENNLHHRNGTLARDNAERIAEIVGLLRG